MITDRSLHQETKCRRCVTLADAISHLLTVKKFVALSLIPHQIITMMELVISLKIYQVLSFKLTAISNLSWESQERSTNQKFLCHETSLQTVPCMHERKWWKIIVHPCAFSMMVQLYTVEMIWEIPLCAKFSWTVCSCIFIYAFYPYCFLTDIGPNKSSLDNFEIDDIRINGWHMPVLNPRENIWYYLDRVVAIRHLLTTVLELWKKFKNINHWNKISDFVVATLW